MKFRSITNTWYTIRCLNHCTHPAWHRFIQLFEKRSSKHVLSFLVASLCFTANGPLDVLLLIRVYYLESHLSRKLFTVCLFLPTAIAISLTGIWHSQYARILPSSRSVISCRCACLAGAILADIADALCIWPAVVSATAGLLSWVHYISLKQHAYLSCFYWTRLQANSYALRSARLHTEDFPHVTVYM